jgi:hypothetical protein
MQIVLDLLNDLRWHFRLDPHLTFGRLAAIGVMALIVIVLLWVIRDFFRGKD